MVERDSYLSARVISLRHMLSSKYLCIYCLHIVPFRPLKSLLGEGGVSIIGKDILQLLCKWRWKERKKEGNQDLRFHEMEKILLYILIE